MSTLHGTVGAVSTLAGEIVPDLPDDVAHDWSGLATWALIVVGARRHAR